MFSLFSLSKVAFGEEKSAKDIWNQTSEEQGAVANTNNVGDQVQEQKTASEKKRESEATGGKSQQDYVYKIGGDLPLPTDKLSLDSQASFGNIYQSIIYDKASEGTGKSALITFDNMANYGEMYNNNYFNYTNPKDTKGGTDETVGGSLSTSLESLVDNKIIVTEKENKSNWLAGLWDKTKNFIGHHTNNTGTLIGIGSSSMFSVITEPIGNVVEGGTDWVLRAADFLTPTSIFGFTSKMDFGEGSKDGIGRVVQIMIEEIIGTGETFEKIFFSLMIIVTGIFTIIGILLAYFHFARRKIPDSLRVIRKYTFMVLVPMVFTFSLPYYAQFRAKLETSIKSVEKTSQEDIRDSLVIDLKKWVFLTNFDMSLLDGNNITTENVKELNRRLNERISYNESDYVEDNNGNQKEVNELIANFENPYDKQSPLDSLLSDETFKSQDYIKFIEKAHVYKEKVQANALPNGMEWGGGDQFSIAVSRWNPLHKFVGDQVSEKGLARFFDNRLPKSESVSEDEDNIDKIGLYGRDIEYNIKNYKFTDVRRGNSWTYIYGAKPSGSYMTSLIDNYTFGVSNTLSDDLKTKLNTKDKAEGSDNTTNDNGRIDDKNTDYYKQLANSLKIGILNRYAGLNQEHVAGNDPMPLSNQSTFFLLSTYFDKEGAELFLTNSNFNESDQGKSGSNTEVRWKRYAMPSKNNRDFFNKLGILNASSLARTILIVGIAIVVFKMSLGALVVPIWTNFKNIYIKGSIFAMAMFYISDATLILFKNFSGLIVTSFNNAFMQVVNRISEEGLFGSAGLFLVIILAIIAFLLVYPLIKIGGKKQSIVEIFLNILLVLRDQAVEPLKKLEQILYGTAPNYDNHSTNAPLDSDSLLKGMKKIGKNSLVSGALVGMAASKLLKEGEEDEEDEDEGVDENRDGNRLPGRDDMENEYQEEAQPQTLDDEQELSEEEKPPIPKEKREADRTEKSIRERLAKASRVTLGAGKTVMKPVSAVGKGVGKALAIGTILALSNDGRLKNKALTKGIKDTGSVIAKGGQIAFNIVRPKTYRNMKNKYTAIKDQAFVKVYGQDDLGKVSYQIATGGIEEIREIDLKVLDISTTGTFVDGVHDKTVLANLQGKVNSPNVQTQNSANELLKAIKKPYYRKYKKEIIKTSFSNAIDKLEEKGKRKKK